MSQEMQQALEGGGVRRPAPPRAPLRLSMAPKLRVWNRPSPATITASFTAAALLMMGASAMGLRSKTGPVLRATVGASPARFDLRPELATFVEPQLRPEFIRLWTPLRSAVLALRPAYGGEGEAAPFVLRTKTPAERARAVACLANAVYYEAALEPLEGQKAVAQVVLNRVRDPNFPHSVCGVVYEGWERPTGCQFSFTCDGSLNRPRDPRLFARARGVAEQALDGGVALSVGAATHYHADYVDPWWRTTVVRIAQIGRHVFYRWPGAAGGANAFNQRYAGGELDLSEAIIEGQARRPVLDPSGAKGSGDAGSPPIPSSRPTRRTAVRVNVTLPQVGPASAATVLNRVDQGPAALTATAVPVQAIKLGLAGRSQGGL